MKPTPRPLPMIILEPPRGFVTHPIYDAGYVNCSGFGWAAYATGSTLEEARSNLEKQVKAKMASGDLHPNGLGQYQDSKRWAYGPAEGVDEAR